tara:strand:+ start:82 stop:312 length:231 start_codon:yes stop_codon:yes gene_type:complete
MVIYKREGVDPKETHWRMDEGDEAVRYDRDGDSWNVSYLYHSGNPFKRDAEYAEIAEADTKKRPVPVPKKAPLGKK